jgi:polyhydroxybutyrate depolymerase
MAYLLDMNDTAAENGFIMVYPDGDFREWHYTNGYEGFGSYTEQDDVEFLRLLLEDLQLDYNIDAARTYLMGFSNGGYMTQRVACEAPQTFDGYAVIGAGLLEPLIADFCETSAPVDIAFIHGTTDPSIPFEGIQQAGMYVSMPIPQTVSFWADKAGCLPDNATDTRVDPVEDDESYVVRYDFNDCTASQVQFFMVVGGGHTIPGAPERLTPALGNYNQDIDTGAVLWEFWQAAQE